MSKKVGLWIDRRSAFIVSFDERGLTTSLIDSRMEPRVASLVARVPLAHMGQR